MTPEATPTRSAAHDRCFTNSGTGGLALTDATALTVTGSGVNTGAGALSIVTTTGDLTVTGALTGAQNVTLTAAGNLAAGSVTVGGNYTALGADHFRWRDAADLRRDGQFEPRLHRDWHGGRSVYNSIPSAPNGSVSVTTGAGSSLTVGDITTTGAATRRNLNAGGALAGAAGTIIASGSYSLTGSTITLTTAGLLNSADTFTHNYSLDFTAAATNVDLSASTLTATAGSVSVTTGAGSNLTTGLITAGGTGGDVNLVAGGTLAGTAKITAGGSYNLTGAAITLTTAGLLNSADTFTHNYSLDFTAAATNVDLSLSTLTATAGSVSVTTGAGSDLTVGAITAGGTGGDVNLVAGGTLAGTAKITAGGSYNLTGAAITLTTAGLLNSADTFTHNYSLDFTMAGCDQGDRPVAEHPDRDGEQRQRSPPARAAT